MDKGQIILYQTPDGESKIEVRLENDTVWLSADQMAELFQRNKSTISRHVKNVLEDGELEEASTVAFFATVQNEGTALSFKNSSPYQKQHYFIARIRAGFSLVLHFSLLGLTD